MIRFPHLEGHLQFPTSAANSSADPCRHVFVRHGIGKTSQKQGSGQSALLSRRRTRGPARRRGVDAAVLAPWPRRSERLPRREQCTDKTPGGRCRIAAQ